MKALICSFIVALCVLLPKETSAKIWIVDRNGNPLADFTTLQAAHDASAVVDGDTLYVSGSANGYGDIILTKRLVVFGPGYFLDENLDPETSPLVAQANRVWFNPGSEGSVFAGFHVVGSGSFTIAVQINASNITFMRNLVQPANGGISILAPGFVVKQNYIQRTNNSQYPLVSFGNVASNGILSNNYIGNNNILEAIRRTSGTSGLVEIEHNVIDGEVIAHNSRFRNNILFSGPFVSSGSVVVNNIGDGSQFAGYPPENQNQSNVDMSTVFMSPDGTTDGQWQLKPGSPAIGAGTSGTDVGMFGGATPYVLSGLPPIPKIYFFDAPTAGSQNQGLPVQIKVKSVN